jgi:hypothetical protein
MIKKLKMKSLTLPFCLFVAGEKEERQEREEGERR